MSNFRKLADAFRRIYLERWWMPPLVSLATIGLLTLLELLPLWVPMPVGVSLLVVVAIALLVHLAAVVISLWMKQWRRASLHLLTFCLCGAVLVVSFFIVMVSSMFGPSDDHFADSLTIPTGIEIADPLPEFAHSPGNTKDCFQAALLESLRTPGTDDPSVTAALEPLLRLQSTAPELLHFFLAASPAWRVFEEHGDRCATRRWKIGSEWSYTLHGYYTRHALDMWNESGLEDFQIRLTIGLDGKPWWRGNTFSTRLGLGETARLQLSEENSRPNSHAVIEVGEYVVEIMEQSAKPERRLTKSAIAFLQSEFSRLLENPTIEQARALLPSGSIRRGEPSIELRKSFQPGLYDAVIWGNPGERGRIYLKAVEITRGTQLSEDRLKTSSNEWIGWSNDPGEQFLSNTHFTIYEGDWGKPYAARFEVWFAPDPGGPERKLFERVFRIEGWQR